MIVYVLRQEVLVEPEGSICTFGMKTTELREEGDEMPL
jgi:hypothetical protein